MTQPIGHRIRIVGRTLQKGSNFGTPAFGGLDTDSLLAPEQPLRLADFERPAVHPVIAFRMARGLTGRTVTAGDVIQACDTVYAALEVIDAASPFATGPVKFAVAARGVDPAPLDLPLLGCTLFRLTEAVASAAGAAVFGHPAAAVAALVRHLSDEGRTLDAGSIVLSGNLVDPVPVEAGDSFMGSFGRLGQVTVFTA